MLGGRFREFSGRDRVASVFDGGNRFEGLGVVVWGITSNFARADLRGKYESAVFGHDGCDLWGRTL